MSNKINIFVIIKDHFCTLENYTNGRISKIDILTFWVIPALCVLGLATYQYEINKELVSLIVNFASIVTSLLISVLVLIYDQYSKAKSETDIQILKKKILEQLFSTVSFTILMGIITVIFCLLLNIFPIDQNGLYQTACIKVAGYTATLSSVFFTPIILFSLLQMILTLFMVLKRLHIVFFTP